MKEKGTIMNTVKKELKKHKSSNKRAKKFIKDIDKPFHHISPVREKNKDIYEKVMEKKLSFRKRIQLAFLGFKTGWKKGVS